MEHINENDSTQPLNPEAGDADAAKTPAQDLDAGISETPAAESSLADAAEDMNDMDAVEDVDVVEDVDAVEDMEDMSMESMEMMYNATFKRCAEGEVVIGKIIQVSKDYVLVDIGYKSEGQIRIQEFMDEEGNVSAVVDDDVEVMVEQWDEDEERLALSKEKAAKVKVWEAIKALFDEDKNVTGVITSRVKGGFSVDIGVQAFLPGSQADLRPIRNMDEMVGKTFDFKILKYNRKRSNIVLSRRVLLDQEREAKRAETLATIHEGKVVEGIVKNITEYGVFVDLGGLDGLLHITDISWGRVKHPSEMFSIGDEINVKVLNLDLENERVSLGMKQLTDDPWTKVTEKYPTASRVTGKVVSLTDYGAFVELEEGVEGLIHVSEMSWTRKIRHPSKIISVGEMVEAVVLDIKPDNRRISLGMKQVAPNPWDVIGEKYPVGTTIEGRIKNITDFGLFIGIDEGIDGLVHISDISWTKRIKHPSELYSKGDVIQAVVLDIDKKSERFSLGIKQLNTDPWKTVEERYQVGKEITGTVTNLTDFGVFVELEEGIEGLVHVSEISKEKTKTPISKFKLGDIISSKVMDVNSEERRIGLSIKRLEMDDEKSLFNEYINNPSSSTSSFGEILRENLQEKLNEE
ncbi:30S ribosomal subunit protein S1 [Candidatus Desulfarcum epimagneticum]|uniref:Small ribosomal subunit protein bS1 n=1 Tax=uncultured Desulfobacteraceae bacterium TaxID=218296 RepID=A0A484HHP0_9BACT|nr:30S ribosomal subunit protein S1 [uncultured Desulfobacteraceae bacterium]